MKIELWNIERVKPYELNAKKHDDKQVAGIAASIERFGFDQPIVVDKDGVIIKGHGRRLACIKLGYSQVPVLVRSDLTEKQVNAARAADNRAAVGDVDTDLLRQSLDAINVDDLKGIFEEKELDFLDADLIQMNEDMFVEDLDEAVSMQIAETNEHFQKSEAKRIPIQKALGFKNILGADQIYLSRFMAQVEELTQKKGDEAFVAFIKQIVESK